MDVVVIDEDIAVDFAVSLLRGCISWVVVSVVVLDSLCSCWEDMVGVVCWFRG